VVGLGYAKLIITAGAMDFYTYMVPSCSRVTAKNGGPFGGV